MADREHTKQPVEETRAVDVEAVPNEEDLDAPNAHDELIQEPTEHLSRPDQPDFSPEEREQYEHPITESERPEDR
jgi:hypothetical protein